MRVALLILLAALSAAARSRPTSKPPRVPPDPRTQGLGRSCQKNLDCRSRSQRCLKMADMNGKAKAGGFCVLPCTAIDAGTTRVAPGQQIDPAKARAELKKKPPPRCPARFACHGADNSTPIDICVKE